MSSTFKPGNTFGMIRRTTWRSLVPIAIDTKARSTKALHPTNGQDVPDSIFAVDDLSKDSRELFEKFGLFIDKAMEIKPFESTPNE